LDGHSIDDFCIIQPPPDDIGISAILTPGGSAPANAVVAPIVILHNYGTATQTTATIVYTVNGAPQGTPYVWTGNLVPGQNLTLTLPTTFVVPTGLFNLCAYTSWGGDQDHSNDTTCIDVTGVPTIAVNFIQGYCDNFDGASTVWTSTIDPAGDPGTAWEWGVPSFGTTNSSHSAPNAWDINLNAAYTNDAKTYLYSPYFDITNATDAVLSVWQNYFTEPGWDGALIEYTYDNINWTTVPTDPLALNWYNSNVNSLGEWGWNNSTNGAWINSQYPLGILPGWNGGINLLARFRYVFTSDASFFEDGFSVDDFCIEVPIPLDILPVAASVYPSPNTLLFTGQTIQLGTYIKNRGTVPITQASATLYVDGFTTIVSQDVFAPALPIQKKDSVQFPFAGTWVGTPGEHIFYVVTSQPNSQQDLNVTNDTTSFTITVFDTVNTYPYCNGFEGGNRWVALNSNTYSQNQSWELGLPSQPYLNSTHGGVNAWTLNTTQDYKEADASSLFSPVLAVSVNKCYKLSFWHNFKTERFEDGGAVEYSLDNGVNWKNIDFTGTPNASLFNYAYTSALGFNATGPIKGWTGISNGWLYGEKILRPNVNGSMIIRWKFAADFDSTQEGWSIDDVCMYDIGFCSPISLEELNSTGFELGQNYPNPFSSVTTFEFMLPQEGTTILYISDILGQIVAIPVQDKLPSGNYSINYDAGNLAPGIYYYTLEYNGEKITKKMAITR